MYTVFLAGNSPYIRSYTVYIYTVLVSPTFVAALGRVGRAFGLSRLNAPLRRNWVLLRVGQNRMYTPHMTVYLVISLPKVSYIHRICIVLANPSIAVLLRLVKCPWKCLWRMGGFRDVHPGWVHTVEDVHHGVELKGRPTSLWGNKTGRCCESLGYETARYKGIPVSL